MDFALSRAKPRTRPAVRLKKARMALIACACITAGAAFNIARDGGPPREGTRAEVSLPPVAPTAGPGALEAPRDAASNSPNAGTTRDPALTIVELERLLEASDRVSRPRVLLEVLPTMVAQNPERIARFAELETDPQLREQLVRLVAQLWAKSDVDRAVAWITSLPDSPERQAARIDVSLAVAETDPTRAVDLRESEVGNVEPDGVLEAIVQRWAERNFESALAWTNARPASDQRDKLLQRLAYVRAAAGAPPEGLE